MTAWVAQHMDKTATSQWMGINWRTVGTIIQRVVKARLDKERLEDLSVIGVDEVSFRRHHEYVTVVVDHLKKRVVWVGEGKGEKTLLTFFAALGPERTQALTHITLDMSAAYRAAIEARAPQAQKVFDRFHVKRWAQWATHSKLKPFVKLSHTVRTFKQGLLAYVSTGLSNGLVEGLNNKIRLLTRRALGFHGSQALAAMIYLCCGGIELTPPLPMLS